MARLLCLICIGIVSGCVHADAGQLPPVKTSPVQPKTDALKIVQAWQGDYPVALLDRLPQGQRSSRAGYIDKPQTFAAIWQALMPQQAVPEIDFNSHLVVFYRNVHFYNRTAILGVLLKEGVVDILARQTMSALPIEDKVALALAVIPRAGVTAIRVDDGTLAVTPPATESTSTFLGDPADDPLNATFSIDGKPIRLRQGRAEALMVPGSAMRVSTRVLGEPVSGDLDGDGDEDVALVLVNHAGGSGVFYYIAVAQYLEGQYRGSNAVLLGDRIEFRGITIRNKVLEVRYRVRAVGEPMTSTLSLAKKELLQLENGRLIAKGSL